MLPLKVKGSTVWWPHQAKEPTLPTILKVICVHFDLPGLAYPSNCSSHQVNRKQTKFIPYKQFQQTSSSHIHWAQLGWSCDINNLSVYQEESGHSFWEKLMRKARARQLAELQFCLHIPQGRARRILTSRGTEWFLFHGLIIFLLEEEKDQAFVLLLLDVLVVFATILSTCRPWWERMGQPLGRLHLYLRNPVRKERANSFASPSMRKIYCTRSLFSTYRRTFGDVAKRNKEHFEFVFY